MPNYSVVSNFWRIDQTSIFSLNCRKRKAPIVSGTAALKKMFFEEDVCALCLEDKHAPVKLECSHSFCGDCLKDYIEYEAPWTKFCPLCRSELRKEPDPKNVSCEFFRYAMAGFTFLLILCGVIIAQLK